jgi:hypothetical protein
MTTLYITPEKFFLLAAVPSLLFANTSDVPTPLLPGYISEATRTVGTGATLQFTGNPFGTFALSAVCSRAGRANVLGEVNPSDLPWFRLSVDGGANYGREYQLSADDDKGAINFQSGPVSADADGPIGVRLVADSGGALFSVGDTFTATTRPPPDVKALIPKACAYADGFLVGSWGDTLPLIAWGEDLEQVIADIVRWRMVCKAGVSGREDMEKYHPDKIGVTAWLRRAQSGEFANHPDYVPSLKRGTGSASTSFPLMVPAVDPMAGMLI